MATKASKLEDDLVEFVESHPETFSEQDVKNLRRSIIIFFSQIVGPPTLHQQNVIYCVKLIIENIYDENKNLTETMMYLGNGSIQEKNSYKYDAV